MRLIPKPENTSNADKQCYNMLMALQKIRLSEGEISYIELGSGPDLLFLHGVLATSEAYIPLLSLLSASYHVIAPTHPGHGESFPIPGDWKLADFTRFYVDFLTEIGVAPAILIGHSFGGMITLLLARQGIGSHVIAPYAPGLPFYFTITAYMQALMREAKAAIDKHPDRTQFMEMTQAAGTFLDTVTHHPYTPSRLAKDGPKFNIHKELRDITIPVDLLWGETDQIVPVRVGEMMKKIIPHAHLTVFPGLGHGYVVTDPKFTYEEIMKVIKRQVTC